MLQNYFERASSRFHKLLHEERLGKIVDPELAVSRVIRHPQPRPEEELHQIFVLARSDDLIVGDAVSGKCLDLCPRWFGRIDERRAGKMLIRIRSGNLGVELQSW